MKQQKCISMSIVMEPMRFRLVQYLFSFLAAFSFEWMNASHDNMHGCWLKWLFLRWKSRFIKKKLKIFLYFLLFWCILKIIFCNIYIYINFFFAESATLTITNAIFMSDINSMGRKERWEFCQSITSYYVRHHLLVDLPVVF